MMPHSADVERMWSRTRSVLRRGDNERPEVVGSCFLVRSGQGLLLITAEHVLREEEAVERLYFDCGEEQGLKRIDGKPRQLGCSTGSDEMLLDVCVVELSGNLANEIPEAAVVPGASLQADLHVEAHDWFVVAGAPVSMNVTAAKPASSTLELSPYSLLARQCTPKKYEELGVDPDIYLAVNWDRKRLYSEAGVRRQGPRLRGLSGAPIWHVGNGAASVAGVATEQHAQGKKAVLGVRWQLVASAIGI